MLTIFSRLRKFKLRRRARSEPEAKPSTAARMELSNLKSPEPSSSDRAELPRESPQEGRLDLNAAGDRHKVDSRGWESLLDELWTLVFLQRLLAESEVEMWTEGLLYIKHYQRRCWAKIRLPSLKHETLCDILTTISLVCRRWRTIVVNSPCLWSSGRLDLDPDSTRRNQRIIHRSQHAPLLLYTDENTMEALTMGVTGIPFTPTLLLRLQTIPNLRSLFYSGAKGTVEKLIRNILPSLPQLICLSLECSGEGYTSPQLPPENVDWSHLRCLCLSGIAFSDCVETQFCSLTDLTITGRHYTVPIQALFKLLQCCTKLVTLQLCGNTTNFPAALPFDIQRKSIHLPCLELLELMKPDESDVVTLLRNLISPTLVFIDQDVTENSGAAEPLKHIVATDCPSIHTFRRLYFNGMGSSVEIRGWSDMTTSLQVEDPRFSFFPGREDHTRPAGACFALDINGRHGEECLTVSTARDLPGCLALETVEMASFREAQCVHQIATDVWELMFYHMPALQVLHLSLHTFGPALNALGGGGSSVYGGLSDREGEMVTLPCPNFHTLALLVQYPRIAPHKEAPLVEDALFNCLERRRTLLATVDGQSPCLLRLELCYHCPELMLEHRPRVISRLRGLVQEFHFELQLASGIVVDSSDVLVDV